MNVVDGQPRDESVPEYLRHAPSLPDELAELAEESDQRPLSRDERQRLHLAIRKACAGIQRARNVHGEPS